MGSPLANTAIFFPDNSPKIRFSAGNIGDGHGRRSAVISSDNRFNCRHDPKMTSASRNTATAVAPNSLMPIADNPTTDTVLSVTAESSTSLRIWTCGSVISNESSRNLPTASRARPNTPQFITTPAADYS